MHEKVMRWEWDESRWDGKLSFIWTEVRIRKKLMAWDSWTVPKNQRMGTVWKRFLESCKCIKISKNRKQLPETVKRRYKGNQTIKQVLVFADKTFRTYKLDTDKYKKLTTEAVISFYKMVPGKINDKINTAGKRITENKTAWNKMFINGKNNCFITLEDHRANFLNNS